MITKAYFVIRPTEDARRLFEKLGLGEEEELFLSRVWSQDTDMRALSTASRISELEMDVAIYYTIYILSDLHEMNVHTLEGHSILELSRLWSVKFIDQDILEQREVLKFAAPEIVQRAIEECRDTDPGLSRWLVGWLPK